MFTTATKYWKNWQYKGWTLLALIALAIVFIVLTLMNAFSGEEVVQKQEEVMPEVRVQTMQEISQQVNIEMTTSFTSVNAAPLISRLGGRVTAVNAPLGAKVGAGQLVLAIDGGTEANPSQVQAQSAAISLGLFAEIEKQTRASLDNAVAIASDSFESAKNGKVLNAQVQQKNQLLAESAVDGAQLNREKSIATDDDLLIRSANLAVSASKITQDQAQLARDAALRQSADAVVLSQKGLAAAQIARSQTLASLASQRAALEAQVRSAQEMVQLMQVTAPLAGEVTRLTVAVGDYISPGTEVGEIASSGNVKGTVYVPQAVRSALRVGQEVAVRIGTIEKRAKIAAIASAPSSASSLWQVDIVSKDAVSPNSTGHVLLPIAEQIPGTVFVPLDALLVRENSTVLFTVDDENIVREQTFLPLHYYSHLVEGRALLSSESRVIVGGNRALREGDRVRVAN